MCSKGQPQQTVILLSSPISTLPNNSIGQRMGNLLDPIWSSWILMDPHGSSWILNRFLYPLISSCILLHLLVSSWIIWATSWSHQAVIRWLPGILSFQAVINQLSCNKIVAQMSINYCATFDTESLFSLFFFQSISMTLFYGHFCSKSVEIDRFLLTQGSLSHHWRIRVKVYYY